MNATKRYNSIENSYQDDFLRSIIEQGYGELDYFVQEKVHGANISFTTDGIEILSAKRTERIVEEEDFYHSKSVLQKYSDKILALFNDFASQTQATCVTVFGELFGGCYPHPDVLPDDNAILVQRGIYYCPFNDFYAFDILVDHSTYLDTVTANTFFEKHGFLYAKTLFKGCLSDCLAYPNAFKTTLPNAFHLPELDGNICEGVVIRPLHPTFLRNGSRVILKNKNEKWSENNNYIDNTLLRNILHNEREELSEEALFLCEELHTFITRNRLDNLISKIGAINPQKEFGKLVGLYSKDVLTDFLKSHRQKYECLDKQESKAVNKFLNKCAVELINRYVDECH